jgi:hypothetical protein
MADPIYDPIKAKKLVLKDYEWILEKDSFE